ncbi:hypothetical protein HPB47_016250, partial [Ixodes persulcatus]
YLGASRSGDPSGHKLGLNLLLSSGQDPGGAKSIKDFNPTDENDYDKNGVYSTYWEDKEKCENSIQPKYCCWHFNGCQNQGALG